VQLGRRVGGIVVAVATRERFYEGGVRSDEVEVGALRISGVSPSRGIGQS
jgi:hypothetical protein